MLLTRVGPFGLAKTHAEWSCYVHSQNIQEWRILLFFFWFFRKFLDFPCRWYACLLLAQHEFEMKPWCVSLKISASSGYHIKKMNKIKTRLFRMRGGSRRCFGRKRFAVIGINSCEIRVQQHKRAMIGMTRPLRIWGRGNTGP